MSSDFWPFVMLPEDIKAAALLQKRPLLSQAIVLSTSWSSPAKQAVQKKRFLGDLSSKYFAFERSLELLQALLVYFGWSVEHQGAMINAPVLGAWAKLTSCLGATGISVNSTPKHGGQHRCFSRWQWS